MQLLPVVDSTGTLQSLTAIVGEFQLSFTFPNVLDASHIDGTRLMALVSTADYFYATSDTAANHASNTFRFAEVTTVPAELPQPELDTLIQDVFEHVNQGHLLNLFLYEKLSSFTTDNSIVLGFIDESGFEPLLQHVRCADGTVGWIIRCTDLIVVDPEFRGLQDQLKDVLDIPSHVSYFGQLNETTLEFTYADRRILTGNPNTLHTLFVAALELEHQLRNYLAPTQPAQMDYERKFGTEGHDEDDSVVPEAVGEYTEIADANYREMLMRQEPGYVDPDDIEAIEDGVFEEVVNDSPVH